MAEHYEAARKALAASEFSRAESEYKGFIAAALRRLGSRRSASGEFAKSIALLEEATELTPDDVELRLDLAGACRASGDLPRAKANAEKALAFQPNNSKIHLELGRIRSQMGEGGGAVAHFEKAIALEPNFENGYALAKEYLKQKQPEQAARIFAEMQAGLGDSPELHLEFGSAYGAAGYPERGIPEFKKALAKNDRLRGGHYSLGAAYLLGLGSVMQGEAEAEFRKELKNYPDDALSLYQLGNIEFSRHELEIAERHLSRAQKLDDRNPDTCLLLAQIYDQTGRAAEAEAELRKSISLTIDPARNNYQVQRAHYLLGRLLMQSGRREDAKVEMKTADRLLKESTAATQGVASDSTRSPSAATYQPPPNPQAQSEADAFELKIKDAVADSYNNLAVMAASANKFPAALHAFAQAAIWNPALRDLDSNWGRAAFSAGDYQQAVAPLKRHLENDSADTWARAALGSSYFSLQNYREAVETLRPMENALADRPQLSYIYAVSQIKSGNSIDGVKRLEALEKSNPDIAAIPEALAEAYASLGENGKAARAKEAAKAIAERQAGAARHEPN